MKGLGKNKKQAQNIALGERLQNFGEWFL